MKTYPVMLPCHGGEDVEIASIAETEDGRCTILRNHIQDVDIYFGRPD